MKKATLLALVLVLVTSLLTGCRWMTDDTTTDSGDNSSVGDSTAGSTPLPTATLPTATQDYATDDTGSTGSTQNTNATAGRMTPAR